MISVAVTRPVGQSGRVKWCGRGRQVPAGDPAAGREGTTGERGGPATDGGATPADDGATATAAAAPEVLDQLLVRCLT